MSPIDLRLQFDHWERVAVQKNNLRPSWFADRFVLRLSEHRSKSVLPRPVPIETGLPDRALVRSQDPRRPFSGQKRCRNRRPLAAHSRDPPSQGLLVANNSGKGLFLQLRITRITV